MRYLELVLIDALLHLQSLFDIEIDGLFGGAAQHVIARRVDAHLVDELLKRHHLAGTLGHAHGLAVLHLSLIHI